jgi:hypothetical protein
VRLVEDDGARHLEASLGPPRATRWGSDLMTRPASRPSVRPRRCRFLATGPGRIVKWDGTGRHGEWDRSPVGSISTSSAPSDGSHGCRPCSMATFVPIVQSVRRGCGSFVAAEDQVSEQAGRFLLHAGNDVLVDGQGERRVGMTEALADDLHRDAGPEQQGCVGVS